MDFETKGSFDFLQSSKVDILSIMIEIDSNTLE